MTEPGPLISTIGHRRRELNEAMVALEAAAARASALPDWLDKVDIALEGLSSALHHHVEDVDGDNGLVEDIRKVAPRLLSEMAALSAEHDELIAACNRIQNEIVTSEGAEGVHGGSAEPARIRHGITELLEELSLHRQKGSDLMFDAYNVDIAASD